MSAGAARARTRCCRSRPPWRSAKRSLAAECLDQVAQRRLARRAQARRDPRRGAARGGLGRAGDRAERAAGEFPPELPTTAVALDDRAPTVRGGARERCWPRSTAGWAPAGEVLDGLAAARRAARARPSAGTAARAPRPASTTRALCWSTPTTGRVALQAGEVHLRALTSSACRASEARATRSRSPLGAPTPRPRLSALALWGCFALCCCFHCCAASPLAPPLPAPRPRRRRPPRLRRPPFGKLRSSSRASAEGLRAIRMRAPSSTCCASGVCASAAASSAAESRRSCFLVACTSRRALRAWAPPDEFTSRPEQALGLRPARHRVLLVHLAACTRPGARASGWPGRGGRSGARPAPGAAPSRPRGARRATSRPRSPRPRRTPRGRAELPTSASARTRSWLLRLRCRQVMRKRRRSSPVLSKCSIALARRQLFDATRAPASAAHACCSPQVRCSTAIRHSSRSKTCARRSSSAVTGSTRRSTRSRRPRPRRTGPTTIAPPR